MSPDEIKLSRASAGVVDLLTLDVRQKFVEAVRKSASIDDVPEPYQSWIRVPASIPVEARRVPLSVRLAGSSQS